MNEKKFKLILKEIFASFEDIIMRDGSEEIMLDRLKQLRKEYFEVYDIR